MLIPQPTSYVSHPGAWTLTAGTAVEAPAEIAALLRELLTPATGLPLPDGPGGLVFTVDPAADLGAEGYTLTVDGSGARATAATLAGLRWAVQTLRQLLPVAAYAAQPGPGTAWTLPYAEITDRPRYPWRGIMIDVARWHQPLPWLHTVVDLLAIHRMNTLHLHLTDDQGWRFESHRHPRLTSVGAWRSASPAGHERDKQTDGAPHGGFYTQDELRGLVAYAARRGVTVVPEIDLPGHTVAVVAAYPELGNFPEARHETATRWGIHDRVLNCDDATVQVMRDVLDELVAVFPGELIHLGGDEVPPKEWVEGESGRARMAELGLTDPEDLLGWWINQLADHLRGHGRRVVVWDELVGRGVPADALIMAWRGVDRVTAALHDGHDVIATPSSHVYLDYNESMAEGEPPSIGSGPTPLSTVYGYDPEPADDPRNGHRVLGVQGNLWTEYLPNPTRAEYNLLPRLCAVAEVGWGTAGELAEFRQRLAGALARFDAMGVTYRPLD
ncbi:beta-hexosaminidase [Catellatospora sp. TT07R-123]|uniref:beta-N-acetylhexosaminidase n=1 Tax=Catellatospora sp. TT07R-123 TaxID=2733863 RepID=UPI001B15F3AE|nr:beta-N-acetylhexosaminidase [Catellatospora sp. TT07R-123]GHJ49520.1 beta-hexosaminidase [Catellatospora sp. TT07R-123]